MYQYQVHYFLMLSFISFCKWHYTFIIDHCQLMLPMQTWGLFLTVLPQHISIRVSKIIGKGKLNCFLFLSQNIFFYFPGNWQPVGNVFAHLSTIFVSVHVLFQTLYSSSHKNGSFHIISMCAILLKSSMPKFEIWGLCLNLKLC